MSLPKEEYALDFLLTSSCKLNVSHGFFLIEFSNFVHALVDFVEGMETAAGVFCLIDGSKEEFKLERLTNEAHDVRLACFDGHATASVVYVGNSQVSMQKCESEDSFPGGVCLAEGLTDVSFLHAIGVGTNCGVEVQLRIKVYRLFRQKMEKRITLTQRTARAPLPPVTPLPPLFHHISPAIPESVDNLASDDSVYESQDPSYAIGYQDDDDSDVNIGDILALRGKLALPALQATPEETRGTPKQRSAIPSARVAAAKKWGYVVGKPPNYLLDTLASASRQSYDIKYLRIYGNLDKPKTSKGSHTSVSTKQRPLNEKAPSRLVNPSTKRKTDTVGAARKSANRERSFGDSSLDSLVVSRFNESLVIEDCVVPRFSKVTPDPIQ